MEKELKRITLELSPHTSKVYTNSYKQIRVILNLKDKRKFIKNKPVEEVVETLDNYIVPRTQKKINPNTKYSYFVVVKKIYMNEKNKDFLMQKEKEYRDDVLEYKKQSNGELQKADLPTFDELNKILKNEEKPMKYLINFLFLKVNVRNQDVAYIKLHKNNVDESKLDNQLNHIYIKDGKAIYLRNRYKTFRTYGQKRNVISVKKFVEVVKQLLGDKEEKLLFSKKDGTPITNGSISSYFRPHLIRGIQEGEIMKITMKHINTNGTFNDLRRVANNRGTNTATLLAEYDISNINEPTQNITPNQIKNPEE
jgi:hypothetical protein